MSIMASSSFGRKMLIATLRQAKREGRSCQVTFTWSLGMLAHDVLHNEENCFQLNGGAQVWLMAIIDEHSPSEENCIISVSTAGDFDPVAFADKYYDHVVDAR